MREQVEAPTRAAADAAFTARMTADLARADANGQLDALDALDATRDYNPAPGLAKITVPVTWINSADDFINAPNLKIGEATVGTMPRATFRLIPETAEGRGHSIHTWAAFWEKDLHDLLARSEFGAVR